MSALWTIAPRFLAEEQYGSRRGNTIEKFCIISTKCETLEGCPPELILCQTGVRWDLSEGSRKMARNERIDSVLSQTICLDAQRMIRVDTAESERCSTTVGIQ